MPKVVDQDRRRREIADALLEVLRRDGVRGMSVRSVAAQAGLSVGSMRHTAASHPALVAFAMQVVGDRAADRVRTRAEQGLSGLEALTDLCCELLPLDAERRGEAQVWLELVTLARTTPELAPVSGRTHGQIRAVVDLVVRTAAGRPAEDAEVVRLHALLDGLALHEVLRPGDLDPALVRVAVRGQLEQLAGG